MSKVYVTGCAGFLGSHLVDHLLAQGHEVVGCDDFSTGDADNLDLAGDFGRRLSLRGIEELTPKDFEGIDVVQHLAALAYEGVSSFAPSLISRNIYAGSAAVFSAAIAAGVRRIVFCSSMARYGECVGPRASHVHSTDPAAWKHVLYTEDMTPRPVDPYGIAKEAAERLLVNLCETHGVEWSIAVPHNIYGPRQHIDPYRNVVTIFANRMLRGEQPIVYGDGLQKRCFSYVSDVVPLLARLGFDPVARSEVVNVGPDSNEITILDLAYLLADIVGFHCDPIFVPSRPREVKHALCSSSKARALFGFEESTTLREGLIAHVADMRRHGSRPFDYHLSIEIESELTPRTWMDRSI